MYNDNQPRDEKGRWTSGGFGYTHDELAEEFDRIRGASAVSSGKSSKQVELPKREYAELCSSIRTKYANKIPTKGKMLYGNNYYEFRYSNRQEKIVCTRKIKIVGNEEKISDYMKEK